MNFPLNIRRFHIVEDAKNNIVSFQPDLIITDIEMPNINGYELIEFIRKISNIPIIAVSGSSFGDNNTETVLHVASLVGANFTLTKNNIQNKLPELVTSIL